MSEKDIKVCNQVNCDKPSDFIYTWPGKDAAGICEKHSKQILAVADAIGLHLQLIPCRVTND